MGLGLSIFAAAETPAATGPEKETDATGVSAATGTPSALAAEPDLTAKQIADMEAFMKMMAEEDQANDMKANQETEGKWPPNQCGYENVEGVKWVPWVPPPRIKESRLTPEERAKFQCHLDNIFSEITLFGKKFVFEPEDVAEVMEKVIPYLESEPMLIDDVPFGVSIIGDLHGQLHDLDRVFKGDAKGGKPGWECATYVLLGDYVDRGRQSLEVIMALFCIKMLHPNRIFILRGNHEFLETNVRYGLAEDLRARYIDETTFALFLKINFAFCYLSVAAIVGNTYFCCHGGISPNGFTRRQLRGIDKPYYNSNDDSLIHDILWADPAEGLRGTTFNKGRGSGIYFGFDALCHALESMEVVGVFRAHERMMDGVGVSWNGCCITIFTATDYGLQGNKGGVAVVDATGKVSFRILEVDPIRSRWEEALEDFELGLPLRKDLYAAKVQGIGHDDSGDGHLTKL